MTDARGLRLRPRDLGVLAPARTLSREPDLAGRQATGGCRLSMPTGPTHSTITATAAAPATAEDTRKTSLATRISVESVSFGAISS